MVNRHYNQIIIWWILKSEKVVIWDSRDQQAMFELGVLQYLLFTEPGSFEVCSIERNKTWIHLELA